MAVLSQMIDSGKYPQLAKGWRTPISSIIREDFVLQDDWVTLNATLEDAACHRTGMASHDYGSFPLEIDGQPATVRAYVRNLRNLPMTDLLPRTQGHYCNPMYFTLGYVIEVLTGKPLGQVLKEMLWAPLGMDNTYSSNKDANESAHEHAKSYVWNSEKGELEEKPLVEIGHAGGAGFVISNVLDYAKWVKCLLNEAEPLSKTVHSDIKRSRIIYNPTRNSLAGPVHYGLGWLDTDIHGGVTQFWHSGSTQTFSSNMFWMPSMKYGLSVIHNSFMDGGSIHGILMRRLVEDKLNIPLEKRLDHYARHLENRAEAYSQPQQIEEKLFGKDLKDIVPSRCPIESLAGTYHNAGYGTLELIVKDHPKDANKKVLWADRSNSIFPGQFMLHHKSSDFWVMNWTPLGSYPPDGMEVWKAQFHFGLDGSATEFGVQMNNRGESEGEVVFKKTK